MKTTYVRLCTVSTVLACVAVCLFAAESVWAGSCTWTGATSTIWSVGGNWGSGCTGAGGAPSATDTVTIPSGVTNQPVITNAVTSAGIAINSGATLTFGDGGTLTLTGDLTNNGTLTYAGTGGDMTFNGTTTFSGTGSWTIRKAVINNGKTVNAGGTVLTLAGTFDIDGTFNGDTSVVTFTLASASGGTVGGNGAANFYHLALDASSKTLDISTGKTISVTGNLTKTAGSFGCGGGTCTLKFAGIGTSVISSVDSHPWNITINAGKIVTTSSTFSVKGNLTNNGTFTQTAGTLTLNGGAAQTLGGSGSTVFNNLTINNTNGVTLTQNATVAGTLALTNGSLDTGAYTLTLSNTTTSVTASGGGDVIGNVKRTSGGLTTGSYLAFNHPYVAINFASGTVPSDVTISLTKTAPPTSELACAVARQYTISANGGAYTATLRLRYAAAPACASESRLKLWKKVSGRWQGQGGTANTTDKYVQLDDVTSFSDWAIADSGSPTAVTLADFSASPDETLFNVLNVVAMLFVLGAIIWLARQHSREAR